MEFETGSVEGVNGRRRTCPVSSYLSGVTPSVASLQLERRESDTGEEDDQDTGREEWVEACEDEEAEEVRNSEEGIHSHVSKSENLE